MTLSIESIREEDIELWRRFRSGESAASLARHFDRSGDVGVSTVLKIVLLVESEMATSPLFFKMEHDGEGCPNPVRKEKVRPPDGNAALESWLRNRT
jgi:hypothetical protein